MKMPGNTRIADLPLSSRAKAACDYLGITTLHELSNTSQAELLRAPNCGKSTVQELKSVSDDSAVTDIMRALNEVTKQMNNLDTKYRALIRTVNIHFLKVKA